MINNHAFRLLVVLPPKNWLRMQRLEVWLKKVFLRLELLLHLAEKQNKLKSNVKYSVTLNNSSMAVQCPVDVSVKNLLLSYL